MFPELLLYTVTHCRAHFKASGVVLEDLFLPKNPQNWGLQLGEVAPHISLSDNNEFALKKIPRATMISREAFFFFFFYLSSFPFLSFSFFFWLFKLLLATWELQRTKKTRSMHHPVNLSSCCNFQTCIKVQANYAEQLNVKHLTRSREGSWHLVWCLETSWAGCQQEGLHPRGNSRKNSETALHRKPSHAYRL